MFGIYEMIDILKKYDIAYASDFSRGMEDCANVFEFKDRKSKLIFSAPHATRTFVNNKEKLADLYTGAIVQYVGEVCDVSSIIRTKYVDYRVSIFDYIKEHKLCDHYFVDVHGFDKDIEYDVCLGIYKCNAEQCPYLSDIVEVIEKYGLRVIVNYPQYTGKGGFTREFQECVGKPNVIQMELKRYLRDFYKNPDVVSKITVPMMMEITNCYKK